MDGERENTAHMDRHRLVDARVNSTATALNMPRLFSYFFAVYFGLILFLWLRRRSLLRKKTGTISKRQHDDSAWWLTDSTAGTATDETGLTTDEAHARLAEFGPNLFDVRQQQPLIL